MIFRLSRRGWTARRIARRLRRDHHTILRALHPTRLPDLAVELAFQRRFADALWVAGAADVDAATWDDITLLMQPSSVLDPQRARQIEAWAALLVRGRSRADDD